MTTDKVKNDKHFLVFGLDNPVRKLFDDPQKFCSYVKNGDTVADLGCGPGFYTISLAEKVGSEGRVYAVDSDEKSIRAIKLKAAKLSHHIIEAHVTSAANLSFIKDSSVDFVLACGLLCSMAPREHEAAVAEIKRILKPEGKAFILVSKGVISYVDKAEWEKILEGFKVERRNSESFFDDRWAFVTRMN